MFLRRSRVATLRGPGSRAAFSLVELLVVIAILVILASFLMPGLSRAKETARRIHCVNNLRQLAIAWEAYAADNEERLAPNGYGTAESLQGRRLWVVGATHTVPQAFTNVDYLINSKYAAFADYLPNREVYKCPSDRSTVALGDKAYPKTRTYALNGYLNWQEPDFGEVGLSEDHLMFRRAGDLAGAGPSEILQFVDSAPGNVCHSGFVIIMAPRRDFYHLPSVSHIGSGTFSFADGHVAWRKWRNSKTIQDAKVLWETAPHLRWVSGNEDLAWLREHATREKNEAQ